MKIVPLTFATARAAIAAMVIALLAPSTTYAEKIKPITLSAQDQSDVQRITGYLNAISSFAGKFQQYADNGGFSTGQIYMRRPGFLRVEYDPPIKILLIADGIAMNYYDAELDQLQQIPLSLSPMWFLLRKKVDLNDDVILVGFEHKANTFQLHLVQEDNPEAGQVILEFLDRPLELQRWTIIDPGKNKVQVGIFDARFGIPLDNKLFATPSRRKDSR